MYISIYLSISIYTYIYIKFTKKSCQEWKLVGPADKAEKCQIATDVPNTKSAASMPSLAGNGWLLLRR